MPNANAKHAAAMAIAARSNISGVLLLSELGFHGRDGV